MPKCEICGKTRIVGNRVSHSNIKTKRDWSPNIQRIRAVIGNTTKRIYVCTRCLRGGKVKRAVN
ncbi:MAG TPA: 50S ribosomal protein L28 [Firmicutes bacterium]|jgi:large subunit ribosomal protein L28|nr:50S ribosomal protein L28 [Bacillota bacterium]